MSCIFLLAPSCNTWFAHSTSTYIYFHRHSFNSFHHTDDFALPFKIALSIRYLFCLRSISLGHGNTIIFAGIYITPVKQGNTSTAGEMTKEMEAKGMEIIHGVSSRSPFLAMSDPMYLETTPMKRNAPLKRNSICEPKIQQNLPAEAFTTTGGLSLALHTSALRSRETVLKVKS